jgi:hypothetical protein
VSLARAFRDHRSPVQAAHALISRTNHRAAVMTARRRFALPSTLLFAVAALLAAAPGAFARGYHRDYGPVEMTLIDRERGYELPRYLHRGQAWVPGTPGHRYAVRLTNRSPERVLVVLSVDGVNAVTGQSARPDQAGYVLEPWQSTEVAGWRKSMRDVAQFYFTDLRDSYAARTGRPHDVGVIGIAVFEDARRLPPPYFGGHHRERAAPDAPAAPSSGPEMAESRAQSRAQSIGTGHGWREYAPVSRAGFIRASRRPVQVTELRYDDEHTLASRGIAPRHYYGRGRHEPRAFHGGFVPDPRW